MIHAKQMETIKDTDGSFIVMTHTTTSINSRRIIYRNRMLNNSKELMFSRKCPKVYRLRLNIVVIYVI
jgi:hypothetical protein